MPVFLGVESKIRIKYRDQIETDVFALCSLSLKIHKSVLKRKDLFAELGTRQFCRDNVIRFLGHKVVWNCHFTIFVVFTPSRHGGLTIFRLFSGPWLFPWDCVTLSRCRVVVLAKLKNCHVPSSGFLLGHYKPKCVEVYERLTDKFFEHIWLSR